MFLASFTKGAKYLDRSFNRNGKKCGRKKTLPTWAEISDTQPASFFNISSNWINLELHRINRFFHPKVKITSDCTEAFGVGRRRPVEQNSYKCKEESWSSGYSGQLHRKRIWVQSQLFPNVGSLVVIFWKTTNLKFFVLSALKEK